MANSILLHVDESTKGIMDELENSLLSMSSNVDLSEVTNAVKYSNDTLDLIKSDVKKIKSNVEGVSSLMEDIIGEGSRSSSFQIDMTPITQGLTSLETKIRAVSTITEKNGEQTIEAEERLSGLITSISEKTVKLQEDTTSIEGKINSLKEDAGRENSSQRERESRIEGKVDSLLIGNQSVSNKIGEAVSTITEKNGEQTIAAEERLTGLITSISETTVKLQEEATSIEGKINSLKEDAGREFSNQKELTARIEHTVKTLAQGEKSVETIVDRSQTKLSSLIRETDELITKEATSIKKDIEEVQTLTITNKDSIIDEIGKRIEAFELSLNTVKDELEAIKENQKAMMEILVLVKEYVTPFWKKMTSNKK